MTPTPRMLVVQLAGDDYKRAAEAHTENRFVELGGTIIKSRPISQLVANTPLKFIEIPKS